MAILIQTETNKTMKPIYLSLLLLSALVGKGQTKTQTLNFSNDTNLIRSSSGILSYPKDTFRCIMLVCDTITHDSWINPRTWWERGFYYYTDIFNIAYLNADKKRVKHFVWLSKSIP